ncbi:hypothetical protein [Nocardia jiangxiensis]|uniref:Tetracyclin repressor-like C-terminal domain-containing protein n=1 Tax=Nocardia jiangxiensis TaxID=282685 RepID=A0ABW6SDN5_9NOCA|nr:hypothetical protein [Nocardia jiangxiensis]
MTVSTATPTPPSAGDRWSGDPNVDELVTTPQAIPADRLHVTLNLALGGLALIDEWFEPGSDLGVDEFADQVSQPLITMLVADPG